MSDTSLRAVLTAHHSLSRSLLQYVSQCEPWHTPARDGLVASIQTFAAWQQTHSGWLEQLLDARYLRPDMTAWPAAFPAYNFCNIDYLLPKLIENQTQVVSTLDDCLLNADSDTEARSLLQDIVAEEHRMLDRLREEIDGPLVHSRIATGRRSATTPNTAPAAV